MCQPGLARQAVVMLLVLAIPPSHGLANNQKGEPFIGKWAGDIKLNEPAVRTGLISPVPQTLTITRTADAFVIVRNNGVGTAYRLDGTESESTIDKRSAVTRLSWNGDELILEARLSTTTRTMAMVVDGDRLTIAHTMTKPSGGHPIVFNLYYIRER